MFSMGGKGRLLFSGGFGGGQPCGPGGVVDRRVGFAIVLQTEEGGPLSGVGERSCAAAQETAIRRGSAMGRGGGTWLLGGNGGGVGGRGTLLPGVGEQAGGLPLFSAGHREGAGRCQGVPVTHRPREGVGRGVPIAPGEGSAAPRGLIPERRGGGGGHKDRNE